MDSNDLTENVEKKLRKMKKDDLELIVQSLKGHSVFYALTDGELEYIVRKMFYCEVANGNFVFK